MIDSPVTFEALLDGIAFGMIMAFCLGAVVGSVTATLFIRRDSDNE